MRKLIIVCLVAGCAAAQVQRRRGPVPNSTSAAGAYNEPSVSMSGTLKTITSKELVLIEPAGGNEVVVHRSRKTKFFKAGKIIAASSIPPGAELVIEVNHEPDLSLLAVNVTVK